VVACVRALSGGVARHRDRGPGAVLALARMEHREANRPMPPAIINPVRSLLDHILDQAQRRFVRASPQDPAFLAAIEHVAGQFTATYQVYRFVHRPGTVWAMLNFRCRGALAQKRGS